MKWELIVNSDIGDEILDTVYADYDELISDLRVLHKPSVLGVPGYQFIIVPVHSNN